MCGQDVKNGNTPRRGECRLLQDSTGAPILQEGCTIMEHSLYTVSEIECPGKLEIRYRCLGSQAICRRKSLTTES
ncbi:hypothetical protein COCC4DRAFT_29637 [Bipolaris maydis ATCC 48331]|uniref:Uncharacterized protein n=2 Tax=Cochliobolus heterostrophus TaxID=5016 RepID=M2SXP2_COCH5|nr:uncharacterized protein COCC4DRAFT_29637 [Bipolaris maydis ATCC 48331]EMD90160.1 hypothetical protein COCHEDRAFT_1022208 [Bipolaris maydis C5]ENI09624.1 hypothetical protein COCC4DRAFT_29637 [Bipolaris maydis ATCC 48331]